MNLHYILSGIVSWTLFAFVLGGVVDAKTRPSSLLRGGRRHLSPLHHRDGNHHRNNGCNTADCDSKLATFLENLKSTQNRRQQHQEPVVTPVKKEKTNKKKQSNRDQDKPCVKRGDCADKKEVPNTKPNSKREEQVTSYLKLPSENPDDDGKPDNSDAYPCNDETGAERSNCGNSKEANSTDTTNTQDEPTTPTFIHDSTAPTVQLPCCCACAKLPCDCQCETFQDSLLYKTFHEIKQDKDTEANGESSHSYKQNHGNPCRGGNCRQGGANVQGSLAIDSPNQNGSVEPCQGANCNNGDSQAADGTAEKQEPALMCCCPKCSTFPCHCSCNYFTLSRIPK